ncbi:MAG: 4Fe-4S dicluster domain-containing protein [Chloroflexi bacterium]|nr:4Fe-4S dicluster domain-containing protein [Chloroflexota bacterium]
MSVQMRRVASEEPAGPAYSTSAPETKGEAVLTAGVKIEPGTDYGFFTDSTVCIGCKACEAACKQWNQLPMDHLGLTETSYDNTGELEATTWRHVDFIEEFPSHDGGNGGGRNRWLLLSDVCKHCENAGCLEACPTGAIVRTEFGSVLIQQDICNGCKYCVPSCPFGVITVAKEQDGIAHKCTLCYDRLKAGLEPACAKACPTDSIQFGPVIELRERAEDRLRQVRQRGQSDAYLYGVPGGPGATGGVGSLNCFFLLTERPEAYNLPAEPELPSRRVLPATLTTVGAALFAGLATAFSIYRAAHDRRSVEGERR